MSAQEFNHPDCTFKHVYGPVPSRRLGRSLGVDVVPFKVCTYDCVYCQLGRTTNKTVERTAFYSVEDILDEVKYKLHSDPLPPDYISISGSGEPTLSSNIGEIIEGVKRITEIPVAVLTNGSLFWKPEIQDALMAADLVLPSLDAGDAVSYAYVNRPHPLLYFEEVANGIASFTSRYRGKVWLEVFLIAGVTGVPSEAKKIANLVRWIGPERVQLNTVCRPPAEQFALPVTRHELEDLKVLFSGEVDIIGEWDRPPIDAPEAALASSAAILTLLRRRPCTVCDLADGLHAHVNEVVKQLDTLVKAGQVTTGVVGRKIFYFARR